LYKHLLETRKNVTTELVLYDKHFKYGHKQICKDKELGNRTKWVLQIIFKSTYSKQCLMSYTHEIE